MKINYWHRISEVALECTENNVGQPNLCFSRFKIIGVWIPASLGNIAHPPDTILERAANKELYGATQQVSHLLLKTTQHSGARQFFKLTHSFHLTSTRNDVELTRTSRSSTLVLIGRMLREQCASSFILISHLGTFYQLCSFKRIKYICIHAGHLFEKDSVTQR